MRAAVPSDTGAEPVRWLGIAAAIASISAVGIAIGLGMPLLSIVLDARGQSVTMIGLNTALAGVASIAAAPFATPLAMRFGVVPTMLAMIVVSAACFVCFFFADSFWLWFPLRAALHVALTVLFILSEFWISGSVPPHRRGLILGLYATVLSLGYAIGPWLLALVGSSGVLPFALASGIVLLGALPVLAAWRDSPAIHPEGGRKNFSRYLFLVPTATAAVLVFGAVETGAYALFPLYGTRIGYSEADTALLLSMVGLGNVLLQIPLGAISDRMRDRRLMLFACAATGLLGMLALPLVAQSWAALAVVLFLWGGAVTALYTVGLAHLGAQLSGRELASANAAFVFCYGVGMLVGPQAIGAGMDLFGNHGFAGALALFFAGYLLLVLARTVTIRR